MMNEWADILRQQRQIIFTGPPGTGKTYQAKRLMAQMITQQALTSTTELESVLEQYSSQWELVQFHPSYNYDDFVRGIRVKTGFEGTNFAMEINDGPLLRIAKRAQERPDCNFVLIIDEINRANVAAVLGEMLYALEYRESRVTLQYGENTDKIVSLPKNNLFIIGTMNTADRSIGHIDYAVRRRFAFIPLMPEGDIVYSFYQDSQSDLRDNAIHAFNHVKSLFSGNRASITSDFQARDVQPGHSYFLADTVYDLNCKLRYQVAPLLREYVADGVLRSDEETEQAISLIEKTGSAV